MLISDLNDLDMQDAYIQNTYLIADNLEKVYLRIVPEFGELEVRNFIFKKCYSICLFPYKVHKINNTIITAMNIIASTKKVSE